MIDNQFPINSSIIYKSNTNTINSSNNTNAIVFVQDGFLINQNGFFTFNLPIEYKYFNFKTNTLITTQNITLSSNGYFTYSSVNDTNYPILGNIPDNSFLFCYGDLINSNGTFFYSDNGTTLYIQFNSTFNNSDDSIKINITINNNGLIIFNYKEITTKQEHNYLIGYAPLNYFFNNDGNIFNGYSDISLIDLNKDIIFNFTNTDTIYNIANFQNGLFSMNDIIINGHINGSIINSNIINKSMNFGQYNLIKQINGFNNMAVGFNSLENLKNGFLNISIGNYSSNQNIDGNNNISFGHYSNYNNRLGACNIAIGNYAFQNNNNGNNNIVIGYQALLANIMGFNNNAVGFQTMMKNVIGSNNSSFGYQSLFNNNGNNNTAIGFQAGFNDKYGSNNIYIGSNSDCLNSGFNNSIVIGCNSFITDNNQIVIGNNTQKIIIYGGFKIGSIIDVSENNLIITGHTNINNIIDVSENNLIITGITKLKNNVIFPSGQIITNNTTIIDQLSLTNILRDLNVIYKSVLYINNNNNYPYNSGLIIKNLVDETKQGYIITSERGTDFLIKAPYSNSIFRITNNQNDPYDLITKLYLDNQIQIINQNLLMITDTTTQITKQITSINNYFLQDIPFSKLCAFPSNEEYILLGDGTFNKINNNMFIYNSIDAKILKGCINEEYILYGDGLFKPMDFLFKPEEYNLSDFNNNMNNKIITNIKEGINNNDAVNLGQVKQLLNELFTKNNSFNGLINSELILTSCYLKGANGPISADLNCYLNYTYYKLLEQFPFIVTISENIKGMQVFSAPISGLYNLVAAGSKGGNINGGKGAIISCDIFLNKNDELNIIVGQIGMNVKNNNAGGGGATYIFDENMNVVLIAAGGNGEKVNDIIFDGDSSDGNILSNIYNDFIGIKKNNIYGGFGNGNGNIGGGLSNNEYNAYSYAGTFDNIKRYSGINNKSGFCKITLIA